MNTLAKKTLQPDPNTKSNIIKNICETLYLHVGELGSK